MMKTMWNRPDAVLIDDLGTSMALWADSLLADATAGMYASLVSFDCSRLLDDGSPFDNELCNTAYSLYKHATFCFSNCLTKFNNLFLIARDNIMHFHKKLQATAKTAQLFYIISQQS